MEISLKAEEIVTIAGFPLTNSLISTYIVIGLLFLLVFFYDKHKKSGKTTTLTIFVDTIQLAIYGFVKSILGEKTLVLYPLIITSFLFIVVSNWFGLVPGVGSLKLNTDIFHAKETVKNTTEQKAQPEAKEAAAKEEHHKVHLLRAPTADLNTTIALALIAVIITNALGFKELGMGHLSKFINFSSPLNFAVGLLELVSELSRVLSYSFRLFGNIFAGEVVVGVMAFLVPVLVPFPFFAFEIFVGLIQGFIFIALFTVFTSLAVAKHH